jgi:hypothetical protein
VLDFTLLAKMIGIFWRIWMAESVCLLVKNTNEGGVKLPPTFVFMTAWVFEARLYPMLLNEYKKIKFQIYTET